MNPLQAGARFAKLRSMVSLEGLRDELDQLATLCDERRQLAEQGHLQVWLHGWLLLHVPLSVVLLVLGVLHVYFSLYY
jgi:hypothetical protein